MQKNPSILRRDFLKLAALGLGSLGLKPWRRLFQLPQFPDAQRLGRVVWWGTELKTRPSLDSPAVRSLVEDDLFPWIREVVGSHPTEFNQRWVETPEGYIWSPHLQPVANQPNVPLDSLPDTSLGPGMWAEVTVPYVDLILDNPPPRAPWVEYKVKTGTPPRLYDTQVIWIDQIRRDENGQTFYRVNERYGYGDIFWAAAEAFRPLTADEMVPITPEVENKRIFIDVPHQMLSCYEGEDEVYFARVSTGALYNASGQRVDAWATPPGKHPIWRKMVSLHMSGGTTGGGWDLPGIGWTSLFVGTGVAIHSTFWHNNYGVPMSRGCVNARPEDAKWIFRWTLPQVPYDPGDVTIPLPGGTVVEVSEY
jgi:lipoprotein-anchoring transpeptidase ErfK/SrfK